MRHFAGLAFSAVVLVACTQDFESLRPGNGGQGGSGGTPSTGGNPQGGGGQGQGGGGGPQCESPTDCGLADECQVNDCVNNACVVDSSPAGTPCDTGVCDGDPTAPQCVQCLTNDDCDGDDVCNLRSNTCVAASCDDDILNGSETDTDCGGGCPPCPNDDNCMAGTDCESGFCDTSQDPAICQPCGSTSDCDEATQYCDDPTDVCLAKKPQGDACGGDEECQNDTCVDGFCCDDACDGTCEACSMNMTGLADGTCSFIVAEEPAGECPDVFGDCLTGTCTGTDASCEVRAAGSDCGTVTCTNGTVHQPQCNSTGQCDQTEDTFCNGHICNGNICDDDCNNQTNQCISGYDCEDSSDVCLKLVGQPCGGNTECLNGQCVDGFCCESTCTGTCKRCDMANTGQNNGLCRNTTNNLDPDNECTNECNGSGACE